VTGSADGPTAVGRFLILGQPRSGTTLVQTLVNSHPACHCRGELFDPWQIDDDGAKDKRLEAVRARDRDPAGFIAAMLSDAAAAERGVRWIGAKILFQHNPRLLDTIVPAHPDWRLVLVGRPNKLAQFASLAQVRRTGRWVDTEGDADPPRIAPDPRYAASECNRLENEDFLLRAWVESLPNPRLVLSYAEAATGAADARLRAFLGLGEGAPLTTPLHRQGQPVILDRFENRDEIAAHFTESGRADWLGAEVGPAGAA